MVQQARDSGEVVPDDHPSKHPLTAKVYEYICNGHLPATNAPRLRGATDEEIAAAFPDVAHNNVRWARWSMTKNGYILDSGIRRAKLKNRGQAKVWVKADVPEKKRGRGVIKPQSIFNEMLGIILMYPQSEWPLLLEQLASDFKLNFDMDDFRKRLQSVGGIQTSGDFEVRSVSSGGGGEIILIDPRNSEGSRSSQDAGDQEPSSA